MRFSSCLIMLALAACAKSSSSPGPEAAFDGGSAQEQPAEGGVGVFGDATPGCVGLACQQVKCTGGATTSIEGEVYDPAGRTKLYNVVAYVPNGALDPMPAGTTCDKCDALASGKPLVAALTDEAGHFKIDDVPVGDNIPLVVQVGKWRRKFVLPHVGKCETTKVDDGLLRLPKNQSEGDIPKMAVVTGGFDQLGCLLARIGIDPAEFTAPGGPGRLHVYKGDGGGDVTGGGAPDATQLWDQAATLEKYDAVLLSCEGDEYNVGDVTGGNKSTQAKEAMHAYANAGGRVFATHYHYTWFKNSPEADFKSVASWNPPASAYGKETLAVDTTFPKGQAFAKWLANVGASTTPGALDVENPAYNVASVTSGVAQRWLYQPSNGQVRYFTFNTPVGKPEDQQCGRAVFTDIHVREGLGAKMMPSTCDQSRATPQELALEFLLFDLTSCIQPDSKTPSPPIK